VPDGGEKDLGISYDCHVQPILKSKLSSQAQDMVCSDQNLKKSLIDEVLQVYIW